MAANFNMIKFFKKLIPVSLVFLPFISSAQSDFDYDTIDSTSYYGSYGSRGGLWNLFFIVRDILDRVIILLIALGVVFFLYGIVKYIGSTDDEENREKSKKIMIYGIISLFVMVSFWGMVNILVITFELDTTPYVQVPYFDDYGGSESNDELEEGADTE